MDFFNFLFSNTFSFWGANCHWFGSVSFSGHLLYVFLWKWEISHTTTDCGVLNKRLHESPTCMQQRDEELWKEYFPLTPSCQCCHQYGHQHSPASSVLSATTANEADEHYSFLFVKLFSSSPHLQPWAWPYFDCCAPLSIWFWLMAQGSIFLLHALE